MSANLQKYAALHGVGLDDATVDKVEALLDALPEPKVNAKPVERLAHCSLQDVVEFTERYA